MQNQDNQTPGNLTAYRGNDVNLMDMLLVLAKHNRFIIKLTASVGILAVLYTLSQPNIYTAQTVILPPQQEVSTANLIMGQLSSVVGGIASSVGKSPNDLYIGLLKSNTLADNLVARFQLQQKFKTSNLEDARNRLSGGTEIKGRKDGFISIEYSDADPKFAAALANAYVEELDKINATVALTNSSRKRLFFEKQLKVVKSRLDIAENALKQTQERTGLVQVEKQSGAMIEAVSKLRAEISAKEVELSSMSAYATPQNPAYRQIQQVIVGLRAQLTKLEANSARRDIKVPTGKLPETSLEFLRKTREFKYQETLFELLSKQYEIAKIDEAKDSTLIQVVDKALVPEQKSKPKRSLIVILATLMAFFLSVLLAFVMEASARASLDPASAERINLLRRYLRRGT